MPEGMRARYPGIILSIRLRLPLSADDVMCGQHEKNASPVPRYDISRDTVVRGPRVPVCNPTFSSRRAQSIGIIIFI